MERTQREEILAFYPHRVREVMLLDPEGNDIEDPSGKSMVEYRRLARRLDAAAVLIAGSLLAMKVAIASDHAAVDERFQVVAHLGARGHDVADLGCDAGASVDYPDYAARVAHAVAAGDARFGVVLCGTGIGVAMAAGKVAGIRAATIGDEFSAEMARRHNDANVACFGARIHAAAAICRLLDRFLDTPFDGGRHTGRVAKIMALEAGPAARPDPTVSS